ncbi:MAG: pyridoxal phosphate-dependent aminotransferase [Spirochaetaceae bacterium]|jgi:putative C-S lyase|nr:pyridoxal phosphate-dependent aminotransferase [Spirochaetaceae bacterium]
MYDFTTLTSLNRQDSSKWALMRNINPNLGPDIVPLSVADMEFALAPEIRQGLMEYLEGSVPGYGNLTPSYYSAVCSWMKRRHNWETEAEWIVPSNGVVPALFHCVDAFTAPGEGVIVMPPVYAPFYRAISQNNRKTVLCPLVVQNGRYEMDFALLEKLLGDRSNTLLLFCSPHNPVGRVWERQELETFAGLCVKSGVTVISDEIHNDLILDKRTHPVLSTISADLAEKTVVCTAPSKTFNTAGFQASNIIIQNPLLRRKYKETVLRRSANMELNLIGVKACELAYTKAEPWLDALLVVLEENRNFTETFIAGRIPGIKVFRTEGTYLQWWDCRGLGMDCGDLERFMTEKALLFLDEGYIFGHEGRGFERINLAAPRHVLEGALTRLEKAVCGLKRP